VLIKYLQITNFRNIQSLQLSFANKDILVVGENGHGKTSILETLYLLSDFQIVRSKTLSEVVSFGEPFSRVEIQLAECADIDLVACILPVGESQRLGKRYLEKGKELSFLKRQHPLPTVLFLPEDVRLFHGPPSRRREWLDRVLGVQLSEYDGVRKRYEKRLKIRNSLLEKQLETGRIDQQLLSITTDQLAEEMAQLWTLRFRGIQELSPGFEEVASVFWRGENHPTLSYQPAWLIDEVIPEKEPIKQWILKELQKRQQQERRTGRTGIGPQLDDLHPVLNNRNIGATVSRGEMRSLSMALKLAEAGIVEATYHKPPVLLLDDILSELDLFHRQQILQFTERYQRIFTATETVLFPEDFLNKAQCVTIRQGKIVQEEQYGKR